MSPEINPERTCVQFSGTVFRYTYISLNKKCYFHVVCDHFIP